MKNIIASLKEHKLLVIFSVLYLLLFTAYFLNLGNGEFIWYALVVVVLMVVIFASLPTSRLPKGILWALSVWGLLHLAGGAVRIGENSLYGTQLIPLLTGEGEMILLKYDQLIHAFGFGVCALIIFHFLKKLTPPPYKPSVYVIAALGGMGLGVVNEIVEFAAFLAFAGTGVGGYVNTSLDLVFNTLGAVVAVTIVAIWGKK
jgi:hypothetical protein